VNGWREFPPAGGTRRGRVARKKRNIAHRKSNLLPLTPTAARSFCGSFRDNL